MMELLYPVRVHLYEHETALTFSRTASLTVAISIVVLICHGIICLFPTRTLSQVIHWFAPINRIVPSSHQIHV